MLSYLDSYVTDMGGECGIGAAGITLTDQTAKYGTGPNEAHQPEAKVRTGPHHKCRKAAPIRTAKARDSHLFFSQIFIHKVSSVNLCLQILVRKTSSPFLCPQIFRESLSTKFHPEIDIRRTLCAKLCKFSQFAHILAHEGSQKL